MPARKSARGRTSQQLPGAPWPVARACRNTGASLLRLRMAVIVLAAGLQLFALDLARGAEAEPIDDEGVVVLLLSLFVGPVVGAHVRFDDELITLARVACESLSEGSEG